MHNHMENKSNKIIKLIKAVIVVIGIYSFSAFAQEQYDGRFRPTKSGIDVATFSEADLHVEKKADAETTKVSILKLRISEGGEAKELLNLPEKGYVFLQHKAGDVVVIAGDRRYEPFEGEWMTIPLPQRIAFEVEDDSVLLDAIVLEIK
ncbi:MAG: hypothetical protein ACU826_02675 [Gammaproteobacteria bacterium]